MQKLIQFYVNQIFSNFRYSENIKYRHRSTQMNGIRFEMIKLTQQINQMLVSPSIQKPQSVFDINFYSFTHKCLHIVQILLDCVEVEEETKKMYHKLVKAMKQAAKSRPQQDIQEQDIVGKDEITTFLNTRKPIAIDVKDRGELYSFLASREMKQKDNETFLSSINKIRNAAKPLQNARIITKQQSTQTELIWVHKIQTTNNFNSFFNFHTLRKELIQIQHNFPSQVQNNISNQANIGQEQKNILKRDKNQKKLNKSCKSLTTKKKLQSEKQMNQNFDAYNESNNQQIENQKYKMNLKCKKKMNRKRHIGFEQETLKAEKKQDCINSNSVQYRRELKMPSIELKQNIKGKNDGITQAQQFQKSNEADIKYSKYEQNQTYSQSEKKQYIKTLKSQNLESSQIIQEDKKHLYYQNRIYIQTNNSEKRVIQQKLKQQLLNFAQQQIQLENQTQIQNLKNSNEQQRLLKDQTQKIAQKNLKSQKHTIKVEKNEIIYEQQEQNQECQKYKQPLNKKQNKLRQNNILQIFKSKSRLSLKPNENLSREFKNMNKKRSNTEDKVVAKDINQKTAKIQIYKLEQKRQNRSQCSNLPNINTNCYSQYKHESFSATNSNIASKQNRKQNKKYLNNSYHSENEKPRSSKKTESYLNTCLNNEYDEGRLRRNSKASLLKQKISEFLQRSNVSKEQFWECQKQIISMLDKLKRGLRHKEYDSGFVSIIKKYSKQMLQQIHQKSCGKNCKHLQRFYSFVKSFKTHGKKQLKISTYVVGNNFQT